MRKQNGVTLTTLTIYIIVATNKGEPAVTDEKSHAGLAYRNIVRRIMGEDVPFDEGKKPSFINRIKSLLMKKK